MTEVFFTPDDWAAVVPLLIDLADSPDHVATSTDNGFQLRIPAYLWERYQTYLDLETDEADDAATTDTPAPKKRGRPRKSLPTSPDEG